MVTCKTVMETSCVSAQLHMLAQLTVLHSRTVIRIARMASDSTKQAAKFANARSVAL